MAYHLHDDKPLVYEGTRVSLRAIDLEKRSGGTHRREIAEVADAVVILPLLEAPAREISYRGSRGELVDGVSAPRLEVVLIRNDRFSVGETLWELPAGTLEEGEDPRDCALRELTEETGYAAAHIEPLTSFYPTPGFCTEFQTTWLATGLTLQEQNLDETEHITVEIVAYDKALAMIKDGTIRDAKTIATLLWFHTFKKTAQGGA